MIILIAAAALNNALGKDNQLLWHLPDDFKRFKALTGGHYIIMGRKTYESLPGQLPNRPHVIITRQQGYTADNCIVVNSYQEALKVCPAGEDIYVIGGGEIYKEAIATADKIELTRVNATPDADAFFPDINPDQWKVIEETEHPVDDRHAYDFAYRTYVRG